MTRNEDEYQKYRFRYLVLLSWTVLMALIIVVVGAIQFAGTPQIQRYEVDDNALEMVRTLAELQAAKQNATDEAYQRGLQDGHKDVVSLMRTFTPDPGCSLILVNENSKWMVCEGEELYEQIQEAWPYD